MRFYHYRSNAIYDIYTKVVEGKLSMEKKRLILRALFNGEHWSWKIVGISKACFEEYKVNKFKKFIKPRKMRKTKKIIGKFVRYQVKSFPDTAKEMLSRKLSLEEWWQIVDKNEKTHLITRDEYKKKVKDYFYTEIPEEGGYFLNKTVGWEYGEKEEYFLRYISKGKIQWRWIKESSKR